MQWNITIAPVFEIFLMTFEAIWW